MRVLERQAAALGQLGGERLGAERDRPGEHAGAALGDRQVGHAADAQVQRALVAPGLVQGPDHREGGEVDSLRAQPGPTRGLEDAEDHVAPRGDEHDPGARPVGRLDDPERMVLEHRLVERHRDVVLGLEANRRGELLGVLERREIDRAHDDALVGDADAYLARRACARRTSPSAPRRASRRR